MQEVLEGRKFMAGLYHRTTGKLCQPSSKWVPFSNLGRIRQLKERDGHCLSFAVPKILYASSPTAPMAIRVWETIQKLTVLTKLSLSENAFLLYVFLKQRLE